MSGIIEKIKTAQDKDGMLRRALERIIQLYTDRSHFVYELLQNAEDAGATGIRFMQYADRLEVEHDGKPFTAANLQGLCDIGKSDKTDNLNQIGEFGVGFKSVFSICEKVKLYSAPEHYRGADIDDAVPFATEIIDFTNPTEIPMVEINPNYTTKFVFPYAVGKAFSGFKSTDALNRALSTKLQNLGITTLLFMKHLELIDYCIYTNDSPIEGQYLLEKETLNDHCSLVSALGAEQGDNQAELISYLMFSRPIDEHSTRTVDIAFPFIRNPDGKYECQKSKNPYISVYFPTETESKLEFIVQGPYRTTPNRSSIPADDADNRKLASLTAGLLRDTLLELRDSNVLNMSFIRALPLDHDVFENYNLFEPLYETVQELLSEARIIPCRNFDYTTAACAKIARQRDLTALFSDELLSDLINDGCSYRWLPTELTETSPDYGGVYHYLVDELGVDVIRPEGLRSYIEANPYFLPAQNNDWLADFYALLENVGNAFSKSRYEQNMLTATIVKTSTGKFVAPYRRTENRQYIPNVFLPIGARERDDIYFVDTDIYNRCRHFFDDILELQKPDEYELFTKDVRKKYTDQYVFNEGDHVDDVKQLWKYLKYEEYKEDIQNIIKDTFLLRCKDGQMRNAYANRIYLPISETGIQIELFLKNIAKNKYFVDMDFYAGHGISSEILCALGVINTLLYNEGITKGIYSTGARGKQPEWSTFGNFRWKLTIDYLQEALQYISEHPSASDSMVKSKTIFALLVENEERLCGTVYVGGNNPNLYDEPCDLVKVIRGEKLGTWNGKWLYTESQELVSHRDVSKYDISTMIYGKVRQDSGIYELLGFKRTETDDVDELKKMVPQKQLDAYFEVELRRRYGITSADLDDKFRTATDNEQDGSAVENMLAFPSVRVKNWDALKKHVSEMLFYADPVKYKSVMRSIRVSKDARDAKAYLFNLYRYDQLYRYACQMCHDACANVDAVQIFNDPEKELDPLHLSLCPNCHALYRTLRNNVSVMNGFREDILNISEAAISAEEHVAFDVDGHEIWFTPVHIAEIQTLLRLQLVTTSKKPEPIAITEEDEEKNGISMYASLVGKRLKRKDGFVGKVQSVNGDYLKVYIENGPKAGSDMDIQISFLMTHPKIYDVEP